MENIPLITLKDTIYVICFDLSLPIKDQGIHINDWVNLLYSALPARSASNKNPAFKIITVGLRQELSKADTAFTALADAWPTLPILETPISSQQNKGVDNLLAVLEKAFARITAVHPTNIPASYNKLLTSLRALPSKKIIITMDEIRKDHASGMDEDQLRLALSCLHAFGAIHLQYSVCVWTL